MKIKNITKIALTLILFIIMLTSCTTIMGTTINPDDFKPGQLTASDTAKAFHSAGVIVSAVINVGLVISVVMFMVLGIKYMMGSVEEKAEYKKTLIPMIIGTLLIFTIGKIVSIIWSIMADIKV